LYKTHPALWQSILDSTSFLPTNAKAKQRVWHIINEVYKIPKCPITGLEVKWWENRYLGTANRSAKTIHSHNIGKYSHIYSSDINQKRKVSNLAAVKNGRKYRKGYTDAEQQKRYQTNLERYGCIHPTQSIQFRKYLSDKRIAQGCTPKHLRTMRDLYYEQVRSYTKISWINYFDKINPNRLTRGNDKFHVDHIFSVQEGFRNNIPPYIIGHWTNLRMLAGPSNSSKGMKCDKTLDQLFEDFFNSQNS
jgi:hypothetical protein